MAPHADLVETLFAGDEGTDQGGRPVGAGQGRRLVHWWAFEPGAAYRRQFRRRAAGGPDELVFDEPAEAAGKAYFRLGGMAISPDGRLAAVMVDDSGDERFTLQIRDLATGEDVETVSRVAMGGPIWTTGSDAVVFTETNEHWRSYRARLHRIGDAPEARRDALRGDRGRRVPGRGRAVDRTAA